MELDEVFTTTRNMFKSPQGYMRRTLATGISLATALVLIGTENDIYRIEGNPPTDGSTLRLSPTPHSSRDDSRCSIAICDCATRSATSFEGYPFHKPHKGRDILCKEH